MLLLLFFPIARRQDIMCDDVPSLRMKTRGAWLGGKSLFHNGRHENRKTFMLLLVSPAALAIVLQSRTISQAIEVDFEVEKFSVEIVCTLDKDINEQCEESDEKFTAKIYRRT